MSNAPCLLSMCACFPVLAWRSFLLCAAASVLGWVIFIDRDLFRRIKYRRIEIHSRSWFIYSRHDVMADP